MDEFLIEKFDIESIACSDSEFYDEENWEGESSYESWDNHNIFLASAKSFRDPRGDGIANFSEFSSLIRLNFLKNPHF